MSLYDRFNLLRSGLSPRAQPPALVGYGVAVLLVGLSTLVGLWFRPATYHSPYLFFYAAILISLLYGGFGAGLASTFLSALLVNLLFQPPYGQFSHNFPDLARGSYFCLSFGFICWLVDTRRKAAEGQIYTQRQLLDMAAPPVIMCDEDDRITYWNKGAEAVYGWNGEEAIGQRITDLLHTVLPEPIQDIETQLTSVGQWSGELKRTRKDGSAAFVASSWTLRRTGRHGLTRLEADHDLTEQRKAEAQLRGSEDQFRTMANAMPQLAWMANPDGWIFWYNQKWYDYTGTTAQQMEGWGWQSVHDPAELPKVMERWQASIATSEPFEMVFPIRGADGVFHLFLTRVMPVKDAQGKVVTWFGTNTDISAQMQVEADLRRSKERLDLALEVADMGEWELDLRNHTASRSLRHDQIFGYTSLLPEWTYEMFLNHVLPEHRAGVDDKFKTSLATGTWDFEARIQRVDGEVRWIWARGHAWTDESGQAARMFGTVMDITDRKRAQEELRESEALYRSLFNSMDEGFCIIEMIFNREGEPVDYRFLEVNPAFEKQTGLRGAVGKRMRELAPSHEAHWFDIYGKIALTGEPAHFENEATALNRYYEVSAYRVGEPDLRQVAIVFNDISRRKRADEELHSALDEKTALLKEVHHRVKNNLQIVSSLLNLQARQVKNNVALETLRDTQGRIRSMALLHETLYREGNAGAVNCVAYFSHLCTHLRHAFGEMSDRVRVSTDIAPVNLGIDVAIPCGLIINELVSNSFKHAFPDGRRGEIAVRVLDAEAEGRIVLSVADDGIGLRPGEDYLQNGTLGTQLVTGLARQIAAAIEVTSDMGTKVQISFQSPDRGGLVV